MNKTISNSDELNHPDIVAAIDYSRILFRTLQLESDLDDKALDSFLAGTPINPNTFFSDDGYINWENQHRIILNALELSCHKGLGILAGRSYTLATHGLVGVAATASATLSESFKMIERYQKTRAQFSESIFLKTNTHYILRNQLKVAHDDAGQFLIEALSMSMMLALDFLAGKHLPGLSVYLNFKKPSYADFIESNLSAKVIYGAEHSELHIPIKYGSLPIASHNEEMRQLAEEQCQRLFQRLEQNAALSQKVLTLLRQSPGQRPSQNEMALAFNMSSRTLLRRLKEEGTTYQQLIDEEYKRLAQHYLEHTHLSIEAIAACMGYHDLSSFRRAFKRWFGMPPSHYQR